jgi:hypothetical protein
VAGGRIWSSLAMPPILGSPEGYSKRRPAPPPPPAPPGGGGRAESDLVQLRRRGRSTLGKLAANWGFTLHLS